MNSRERTYAITSQIPKGKVLTYKTLAILAQVTNPRLVGMYLHQNHYNIPCYRVVNSQGKVAKTYAFGGGNIQLKKLQKDGIKDKLGKIDLSVYLWTPSEDESFFLHYLLDQSFSEIEQKYLK